MSISVAFLCATRRVREKGFHFVPPESEVIFAPHVVMVGESLGR